MDPTNTLLASEVAKLRIVWFCLVQNETPEGFNREETERQLIEFAKELVVMGKVTPEKVRETLEEKDYRERITDLIEIVTKAAYDVKEENFNSRLRSLVKQYEEHQRTVAAAKEKQAQAELSKHNRQDLRDKIAISFDNLQKQIAEQDPQSTTGEYLEASREYLEPQMVLEQKETSKATRDLVRSTSTIEKDDLTATMAPVVDSVTELSPVLSTFKDNVANQLSQASPTAPLEEIDRLAAEAAAQVLLNDEEDLPSVEKFVKHLTLELETKGFPVSDDINKIIPGVMEFKIPDTIPEQVEKTLSYVYEKEAELDPQTAKEMAKLVIYNHLPDIALATSKHVKHKSEDSPEKRRNNQLDYFSNMNRRVLDSLEGQIPQPTLMRLKKISDYSQVARVYANNNEEEYLQQHEQEISRSQGSSWLVNEFQNQAVGMVKDATWKAVEEWAGGAGIASAGGVAGAALGTSLVPVSTALVVTNTAPIVGIIVGEATPAWVMAGIGHGLMNGTAVYAGTLATGEMMFVAPSSLATAQALIASSTGTSTAATTAATSATAGGLVAGVIAGIGIWLATNLPKIWNKIKDKFRPIMYFVTGGGAIALGALAMGMPALGAAGAGFLGGIGAVTLGPTVAVRGILPTIQAGGRFASKILFEISTIAAVEIGAPIVMIIVSIPIVVALLLFMINNSAYIVPSSSPFAGSSSLLGPGGQYPSCWPVNSGAISQGLPGSTVCYGDDGSVIVCSHSSTDSNAVDISVPDFTPVFSTHDGIVTTHDWTVENTHGYGNLITITSVDGTFVSYYAHLESFNLGPGARVPAGTQIALSDNTGNSTGPHLHYELRRLGTGPAPIDLCTFPNGSLDSCVPPYSVGAAIAGCVASSSGGNQQTVPAP